MLKYLCLCACLLAAGISACAADTINVHSGSAAIGQSDPNITVRGAAVTVQGVSYPAASITPGQALVISPNSVWTAAPTGSLWVGVANGNQSSPRYGYIYTTSFLLPQAFTGPSISLTVAADDGCDAYLNGHMLGTGAHLEVLTTWNNSTASWFNSGANLLEFYMQNNTFVSFNPSGLAYSGTINFQPVPEPSSILAIICGLGGLAWRRRK